MELGFPFDIASYGFLLSMLCQVVNMVPGQLKCCLGDTHIYLNQLDGVNEQIVNAPFELPKIELNKEITDIFQFSINDFTMIDYKSHDKVNYPLSN